MGPCLYSYCYQDRLRRLQLPSLELRRLYADLVWCYKILFGNVDVQSDIFSSNLICVLLEDISTTYTKIAVRAAFLSERDVDVWNSLPDSVDFSTLSKFRRSIMRVDFFSEFLRCF